MFYNSPCPKGTYGKYELPWHCITVQDRIKIRWKGEVKNEQETCENTW